jgi:perosamine synthetase
MGLEERLLKVDWAIPNIQKREKEEFSRVLKSGWLSMGNEVKNFEENIASYLNINFAVAVNSGTSALDVALKCLNTQKNDEIIIPALTYIATGNVVLYNNANPVFVDIDETLNIDPKLIKDKITEKTKAIINIDLGGNPANYTELLKISKKEEIPLIVDGAQSFGSEYNKEKCCTQGLINTTSFHAAKILTTIEGGMIFTRERELFLKAKSIRNQGETSKYIHTNLGNNYRLPDLLAVIGNSQIKRFNKTIFERRKKVNYYKDNLKNVSFPKELPNTKSNYFFFLILVENRDELNKYLNKNGIDTRITYPMPINEQTVFKKYSDEIFPYAKDISRKIISLPLHYKLTKVEQDFIIDKINNFER